MWLSKRAAERWAKETRDLKELIKEYRAFLEEKCGFEKPPVSSEPMQRELDILVYTGEVVEYERKYKEIGLLADVKVGGREYDVRNSRYNTLAVEKLELEQKILRLELAVFLFERMVEEYQRKDEKNVRKSYELLEKIEKDFDINDDVVHLYDLCKGLPDLGGEPEDLDQRIKRAEKIGRPLNKKQIDEVKKEIEITNIQNKLLEDFKEYLRHKDCSGLGCNIGNDDEKCMGLRKRFERHKFETELACEGFSKKRIKEICNT